MVEEPLRSGEIRVLFLGSGTSTGVPLIGCDCEVCSSEDSKDKRLRASVLFSWVDGETIRNILIDTSTDLRQQSLLYGIKRLDSVLFTHPHADHIHGIDELRSFNFIQKAPIDCYGSEFTLSRIRTMFDYIFNDSQIGGGKPQLVTYPIDSPFRIFGKEIVPLKAWHGDMEVFGYRIGPIAYLTDCNRIPGSTLARMKNLEALIIGAVRVDFHVTHFNIEQAVEVAQRLGVKKTYITHMNHQISYAKTGATLPENIFLSFDGLVKTIRA